MSHRPIVCVVELHARLGDEFRLLERIGEGGMAHVWRARDRAGEHVAIKVLKACRIDEPFQLERFRREAELAARVRHDNVVGIVAVGTERGHPWVAMELVEGLPFDEWLDREQPRLDDVLDVIAQILSGVQAVHDAGVIHRDVKPSNVLVARVGSNHYRAKLIDFGISIGGDIDHDVTARGMVVGSIPWMAPERLMNDPASVRSDVYSVGLLLRLAVTAKKPFSGLSLRELVEAITHGVMTPLETSAPWLPESLASEIERACATDPAQRHESAAVLRDALLGLRHRLRTPVLGQALGPQVRRSSWFSTRPATARSLVWVTVIGLFVLAASVLALIVERAT